MGGLLGQVAFEQDKGGRGHRLRWSAQLLGGGSFSGSRNGNET